jgi:hypothetical protein
VETATTIKRVYRGRSIAFSKSSSSHLSQEAIKDYLKVPFPRRACGFLRKQNTGE